MDEKILAKIELLSALIAENLSYRKKNIQPPFFFIKLKETSILWWRSLMSDAGNLTEDRGKAQDIDSPLWISTGQRFILA